MSKRISSSIDNFKPIGMTVHTEPNITSDGSSVSVE